MEVYEEHGDRERKQLLGLGEQGDLDVWQGSCIPNRGWRELGVAGVVVAISQALKLTGSNAQMASVDMV